MGLGTWDLMRTALFISPHLDDVAFSCAGTLIKLAGENWQTVLCTIFTQSVVNPTGFALACQTDKGLSPQVDYMALRRAEDAEFARLANAAKVLHLIFPEAPHRGYNSAPELFVGIKDGDQIWRGIGEDLKAVVAEISPQLIFAPQGIGNHVDHLHAIKAVLAQDFPVQTLWYRDAPYVIRNCHARSSNLLPQNLSEQAVDVSSNFAQKITACGAYATQIGFQFGGAEKLGQSLRGFHEQEAQRMQIEAEFAEVFLTDGSF